MKIRKEDILHLNANSKIFQNANGLRKEMTRAEDLLWNSLKNKRLNGLKFRRQHPILNYIADFYCHEAKLIVEIDGAVHSGKEAIEHDRNRSFELNEHGYKVIRFSNEQVIHHLQFVLNKINIEANSLIINNKL
jgi:very-short-patch-repair endonuclease